MTFEVQLVLAKVYDSLGEDSHLEDPTSCVEWCFGNA